MGLDFTIEVSPVDENLHGLTQPVEAAEYLARKKAEAFLSRSDQCIILTADTIVAARGKIYGKAANALEAGIMLSELSGITHEVITAICLTVNGQMYTEHDVTHVSFSKISKVEIDYYIHHFAPFDKAGAYGIQEWIGMTCIEKIDGSYFNVVGLPTHLLYSMLKKLDLLID